MTRITVSFNTRLAAEFALNVANDNEASRAAVQPLEVEDITHDVARAAVDILAALNLPRRSVANRIANALYNGSHDVRYDDGTYFLAGYCIDEDLSSDWTFTWLKDFYAAANDNGPLPSLTPMTQRRLQLLILWFFIDNIDRGERLGLSPRFIRFDDSGRCIAA